MYKTTLAPSATALDWLTKDRHVVLKMFHQLSNPGGSVAFWEQTWRQGDYMESARFCDVDPLRPLLERHAQPGSVLLEGGCGRGGYVAYHSSRGVRAVGLDFAVETLSGVRSRYPNLLLGAADVARLPLRDGCVATYYSGGVVEHFESGPHEALAEARRVLSQNGTFLVSVPYFSPLRRGLATLHRTEWRRTKVHAVDTPPPDQVFFQYAYTPGEFRRVLAEHGFLLVDRRGYSILWGLYELPLINRALGPRRLGPPGPPKPDQPVARPTGLVKRLVVTEDDSVPVLGWIVRLLRWLAANMMMYVCVPAGVESR